MMVLRPAEQFHVEHLAVQEEQIYLSPSFRQSSDWIVPEATWAVESELGVLGVGGIIPVWENRAVAWALLSKYSGQRFVSIHRMVKRMLDTSPYRRIECTVDVEFGAGRRWAELLGFTLEGYMEKYTPDGRDQLMYARVR